VDGSIAVVTLGAGGAIEPTKLKDPIVGFAVDQKGLIANLKTLVGQKEPILSNLMTLRSTPHAALMKVAYLQLAWGSGIVIRIPPITSPALKSLFGLLGCTL